MLTESADLSISKAKAILLYKRNVNFSYLNQDFKSLDSQLMLILKLTLSGDANDNYTWHK